MTQVVDDEARPTRNGSATDAGALGPPVPREAVPRSWDWDCLNAALRHRLIRLGMTQFRLSREEAEDIVQTVLMNASRQETSVRDPAGYIRQSYLNGCRNAVRDRPRCLAEAVGEEHPSPDVDGDPERLATILALRQAIGTLPPEAQRMLRRYFNEGATLAEIGGAGVRPSTVWKKLRATVKTLRIELNGQT